LPRHELRLDEEELQALAVDEERPLKRLVCRHFIADVKLAVCARDRGVDARHARPRRKWRPGASWSLPFRVENALPAS